ncbi:uncharacterized protein LOC129245859 [Anastrepha obliqua]|uniref:uncharacterized protein LOC129245859 n=1 Tax=Anastrepha obliqua TaxID=95512 RepID=UPI00240A76EC|nr:uncharacterized protein LOC129245859 [Anastrepha obliqua]
MEYKDENCAKNANDCRPMKSIHNEVAYIQKKVSALQIGPNQHKKVLSKSAKKRLRKKRLNNINVGLDSVLNAAISMNTTVIDRVQKTSTHKIHKNISKSVSHSSMKEPAVTNKTNPRVFDTKKRTPNVEPTSRKPSEKLKTGKDKFREQRGSNIINGGRKTHKCVMATEPNNKTVYSFVVKGSLNALPTEHIIRLLKLQNFATHQWTVRQRKEICAEKSVITVSLDPESENLLKIKNFKVLLLKTTVTFKAKGRNFLSKSSNSIQQATDEREIYLSRTKLIPSSQLEAKPFSWLGKWRTFTTVLNKLN